MNFFRFASLMIVRNFTKNITIFFFFTLFIFVASSFIFTSASLKNSLDSALINEPDIIIQSQKASYPFPTSVDLLDEVSEIVGVSKAYERVFGLYHFNFANRYINVVGVDFFDESWEEELKRLDSSFDIKEFMKTDSMLISSSVKSLLDKYYYKDYFNFIVEDDDPLRVKIYSVFDKKSNLFLNDSILIDISFAKQILGYEDEEATQIALVVPNKLEIDNIVQKLLVMYPTSKIITKDEMIKNSHELYDYKGGVFLSLFLSAFLAFLVIFYTQMSANAHSGKRQIGILRAIGWSINDIIKWKMSEAVIVSLLSFLSGVVLSYLYIFLFNNNIFLSIFLGSDNLFNDISMDFYFDTGSLFLLFLTTVIPYLATTLHPSWKAAITDPTEAMR